jgi:hypothetical protein
MTESLDVGSLIPARPVVAQTTAKAMMGRAIRRRVSFDPGLGEIIEWQLINPTFRLASPEQCQSKAKAKPEHNYWVVTCIAHANVNGSRTGFGDLEPAQRDHPDGKEATPLRFSIVSETQNPAPGQTYGFAS